MTDFTVNFIKRTQRLFMEETERINQEDLSHLKLKEVIENFLKRFDSQVKIFFKNEEINLSSYDFQTIINSGVQNMSIEYDDLEDDLGYHGSMPSLDEEIRGLSLYEKSAEYNLYDTKRNNQNIINASIQYNKRADKKFLKKHRRSYSRDNSRHYKRSHKKAKLSKEKNDDKYTNGDKLSERNNNNYKKEKITYSNSKSSSESSFSKQIKRMKKKKNQLEGVSLCRNIGAQKFDDGKFKNFNMNTVIDHDSNKSHSRVNCHSYNSKLSPKTQSAFEVFLNDKPNKVNSNTFLDINSIMIYPDHNDLDPIINQINDNQEHQEVGDKKYHDPSDRVVAEEKSSIQCLNLVTNKDKQVSVKAAEYQTEIPNQSILESKSHGILKEDSKPSPSSQHKLMQDRVALSFSSNKQQQYELEEGEIESMNYEVWSVASETIDINALPDIEPTWNDSIVKQEYIEEPKIDRTNLEQNTNSPNEQERVTEHFINYSDNLEVEHINVEVNYKMNNVVNILNETKLNDKIKEGNKKKLLMTVPQFINRTNDYGNGSFQNLQLDNIPMSSLNKLNHNNLRINLVLDLDSTVIYATHLDKSSLNKIKDNSSIYDTVFHISPIIGNVTYNLKFKIRKYLIEFISRVKPFCDFYIYTHGKEPYAREVIKILSDKLKIEIKDENIWSYRSLENNKPPPKTLAYFAKDKSFNDFSIILDDTSGVWCEDNLDSLVISKKYIAFFPNAYFDDRQLALLNNPNNLQIPDLRYVFHYLLTYNKREECKDLECLLEDENRAPFSLEYDFSKKLQLTYITELIENTYKLSIIKKIKPIESLKQIKANILRGVVINTTYANIKDNAKKLIQQIILVLGGSSDSNLGTTTHFVLNNEKLSSFIEIRKNNLLLKTRKYFCVNLKWLFDCYFFWRKMDETDMDYKIVGV